MNRISRTIALSTAAVLALGIAACSPTNQKNSDAPQVTSVSPDSGLKGAGQPETSATNEAGSTDTEADLGADLQTDSTSPTAAH